MELLSDYLISLNNYFDDFYRKQTYYIYFQKQTPFQMEVNNLLMYDEEKYEIDLNIYLLSRIFDKAIADKAKLNYSLRSLIKNDKIKTIDSELIIKDYLLNFKIYINYDTTNKLDSSIDILLDSLKEVDEACELFEDVREICQSDRFWERKIEHDFGIIIPWAPNKMEERYHNHGCLLVNSFQDNRHINTELLDSKIFMIASQAYKSFLLDYYGNVWMYKYSNLQQIALPVKITQISCSILSTLLLDENGDVWSLGNNEKGQLGLGDVINRKIPTKIDTHIKFVKISCGSQHSLFLSDDGDLYVCGDNRSGQLGLNLSIGQSATLISPIDFKIRDISAGSDSSIILDEQGQAWGFGSNSHDSLGLGTQDYIETPTKIDLPVKINKIFSFSSRSFFIDEHQRVWATGLLPVYRLFGYRMGSLLQLTMLNFPIPIISIYNEGTGIYYIDVDNNVWAAGSISTYEYDIVSKQILSEKIKAVWDNPQLINFMDNQGKKYKISQINSVNMGDYLITLIAY